MIKLTKKEIENYNQVLKELGYNINIEGDIHVDKQGHSEELAKILGEDYLGNFVIIVNSEQKNAHLQNQQFSFLEDLLEKTYEQAPRSIEKITEHNALYGEIGIFAKLDGKTSDLSNAFEKLRNPASLKRGVHKNIEEGVILNLDTVDGAVSKARNLVEKIEAIKENRRLALDLNYLDSIKKEYGELFEKYGNLKDLELDGTEVALELPEIFRFSNGKHELYITSRGELNIFYFGNLPQQVNSLFNNFIYSQLDILGILLSNGFLKYDTEFGDGRMKEMEDDLLVKHGYRLLEKDKENEFGLRLVSGEVTGIERYSFLLKHPELFSEIDPDWKILEEATYSEGNIKILPFNLRVNFIMPATSNPIVHEILSKLNPSDYIESYKYDPKGFKKLFEGSDIETRKTMLRRLERLPEEEKNQEVDDWLESHTTGGNNIKLEDVINV